jgi:hypothetical protein
LKITFEALQREGFSFPPANVSATAAAIVRLGCPDWTDSNFARVVELHLLHLRENIIVVVVGSVFAMSVCCVMDLPALGCIKPVRVCDGCFHKHLAKNLRNPGLSNSSTDLRPDSQRSSGHLDSTIQSNAEKRRKISILDCHCFR